MDIQSDVENIICRYLTGTISAGEYCKLTEWLAHSAENQLLFDQVREVWLASELAGGKAQFDFRAAFEKFKRKTGRDEPMSRFRQSRRRRTITISYRWAAVMALMAIVGGMMLQYWMPLPTNEPVVDLYQEVEVPYGARSKVLLPDGSRITLNAGTTLRYHNDFGKSNRDLWLDGEGYFVVNKSATPFVVHTGTIQIKALGTQFNVRAYSSEQTIETTLVEGKVSVSDTDEHSEQVEEVILLPNQKLTVTREERKEKATVSHPAETPAEERSMAAISPIRPSSEIVKKEMIDPLPEISWKDNEWVIYRESMENLAVKLERKFDIKIVFNDERVKSFRYNGTLPDESLEQVLNAMSLVSPIKYTIKGKTVIFSEKIKNK